MSSLRELCCPVKALGSVTINGSVIARGETIQQFGELRIDLGTYRQDDIVLYNEGQQWTPVSIEGNVLVYSLMSNGKFYIYDNARRLVFDFSNNMQQDFTIARLYAYNTSSSGVPGPITEGHPYRQLKLWRKSAGTMQIWVESTGTSIATLEPSSTNGSAGIGSKAPELGDDICHLRLSFANAEVGKPSSLYLGDVLVAYIEEIKE